MTQISRKVKIERDIQLTVVSLNHWIYDNYLYNNPSIGPQDCALCKEYFNATDKSCWRCPIYEKTGQKQCNGTPYIEILKYTFYDKEFKKESLNMILFLSELLKELKEKLMFQPNSILKEHYNKEHETCGLKVGDRVKIKYKCSDFEKGWGNGWSEEMDIVVGKIGVIVDDNYSLGFSISFDEIDYDYSFPYFVLEKVENTGYETTDLPITLKNLWEHLSDNWKDSLIKKYGKYGFLGTIDFDEIMKEDGILWLERKGFIKEIKPERFYSVGDKFSVGDLKYIISSASSNEIVAININSGNRLHEKTFVKDEDKITEEEVKRLFCSDVLTYKSAKWEKYD